MQIRNKVGPTRGPNKVRSKKVSFDVRTGVGSEKCLLSQAKEILKIFQGQGLLCYRRIHVMPIKINRVRTRPNIDMQGMEDLQIALFGGRTLYVELKSGTGRQSIQQKARQDELQSLGHHYYVIKTPEELIQVLRQNGLSMWAFPDIKET